MAGVEFKHGKLHGATEVKAYLRHSEKEQRLLHDHSNKQINKNLTKDFVFQNRGYDDACKKYDDRIEELDRNPKQNHKADRVTCFSLEITLPEELMQAPVKERLSWFNDVHKLVVEFAGGKDNTVGTYIHGDEVNKYYDPTDKTYKMSRWHMHDFVIPVDENGKLNGKWFSSRSRMNQLNSAIDKMSRELYGVSFMTGKSKQPNRKTVEQLKNESKLAEQQDLIEANSSLITRQQSEIAENDRRIAEQAAVIDSFNQDVRETRVFRHFKANAEKAKQTAELIVKPFKTAQIQENLQRELQRLVNEDMRRRRKEEEREKELEAILPTKSGRFDRSL